jgi:lipopolysaccharide assembly outer membrane protein LptD (OstA)
MKLFIAGAVLSVVAICVSNVAGQTATGAIKHVVLVSTQGTRGPVFASARNVVKGVPYPSIAHLKGDVEIRANGFVLNAEQADYDEQTGEIKASGNVSIRPYPPLP